MIHIDSCNLLISRMISPAMMAVLRLEAEGGTGEDVHVVKDQLHGTVLGDPVVVLKLTTRDVTGATL